MQEIIKNDIEDPSFKNDIDNKIKNMIFKIKPSLAGMDGYGGEKEAIRITLRNCVTKEQIEAFIYSDEKRSKFFKNIDEYKHFSNKNIFSGNSKTGEDIVSGTADRIYAIRCRIVHAKEIEAGEKLEPPLPPFSKEAGKLQHDIDLVKFIARAVIVASKQQLSPY